MPSFNYKKYASSEGLDENAIKILEYDGKNIIGAGISGLDINYFCKGEIKRLKLLNDPGQSITAIYYDKPENTLWVGTSLFLYSFKDGNIKKFNSFISVSDSALHKDHTNYAVYEIVKGSDGNIWISTNSGIFKISQNQLYRYDIKDYFFRIYTLQEDENCSFYLGSNDGLYKFINGKYIYYGNKNPLLKNRITFIKKCST